jgi:hypothetical protein
MPAVQIPHFNDIRRLRLRIGKGVFLADDRGETRE